jgi:hypothetical protein
MKAMSDRFILKLKKWSLIVPSGSQSTVIRIEHRLRLAANNGGRLCPQPD